MIVRREVSTYTRSILSMLSDSGPEVPWHGPSGSTLRMVSKWAIVLQTQQALSDWNKGRSTSMHILKRIDENNHDSKIM